MSRLSELVSKGVRLIVADVAQPEAEASPPKEREIPAEAFEGPTPKPVERSEVPASVADFGAVYEEAGIELPLHGYGVDKVGEMLESKRLAALSKEVKATAVMAAIEAAQVPIREVIQDAVLRDKALDAFEAAKEREISQIKAGSEARIKQISAEIDAFLREKNAEIEELKKAGDTASRAFQELQGRKKREEERIHDIVSHFIEGVENPITRGSASSPPAKPDKA